MKFLLPTLIALGCAQAFAANRFTIEPFRIDLTIEHGETQVAEPELIVYCRSTTGWLEPSTSIWSAQAKIHYRVEAISSGTSKLTIENRESQTFSNPYGSFGRKECELDLAVVVEDQRFADHRGSTVVGSLPRHFVFSRTSFAFDTGDRLMDLIYQIGGTRLLAHYFRDSLLNPETGEYFWYLLLWDGRSNPDLHTAPYYLMKSRFLIGDSEKPLRVGEY